ncbi:MAG TPA: MarR family winged helix-turn-helix transcriptional regulator [Acidimicrobiales bacterium]|nr:MarR family winged helix-turn-helix transcriptional regulator [Acidimicrobiales bacterium]
MGGDVDSSTRWLTEDEQAAWSGLQQMQGMLSGRLNRELAASSGLSLQDYAVLVTLSAAAEHRMRAFELGRLLGWEKSRLSHHVARMAGRGLVCRQRCPNDQRGHFVVLTDAGEETLAAAAPGHCRSVRHWFVDRLSPTQLAALADITRTVRDGLGEVCDGSDE